MLVDRLGLSVSACWMKWAVFLFSRLVVYFVLPLQWSQAYTRMHHLDIWELRRDYFSALWNLNCQPPLFNAWIGFMANVFPDAWAGVACQVQYFLLASLGFYVFLRILDRARVNGRAAAYLSYAYALLPTLLYAERWLTYTFPVAALLLLAVRMLQDWHETARSLSLFGYLFALLLVVLMRSLYHPVVWLVPCVAFAMRRGQVRKVLCMAVPVILIALAPLFLNLARYDMFTNSTWQGMNLFRTMQYVTHEEKMREVEQGNVPGVALLAPIFEKDETYFAYLGDRVDKTGIPVLDNVYKSSSETNRKGQRNSNALFMIELSKDYQASWFSLLKRYPMRYLASVVTSAYEFFSLDIYRNWTNRRDWLPQWGNDVKTFVIRLVRAILLPLGIASAFFCSLWGCLRAACRRDGLTPVCLFVVYTLCLTAAVASFCEAGETSVMRVPIEPLVLFGVALIFREKGGRWCRENGQ